ncbi:DUF3347 domain-containing protein [Catalinimonas sp. 4WD22]|uniref:DUF3347 domain-containing protein n=1 Tax=Catalinimonas locisalis TaxID=3133978 RepID=UPI0031013D8B
MKSIIVNFKLLALGLIIFGVSACSGSQESESDTASEQTTDEVGGVKKVGSVVAGYLKLKDALVASNPEEAKEYAVATLEVVDAVAMPEVQQSVKEIAATTDIEEQRRVFENFSIHLYRNLKASNVIEQTLYKQYCPMAFDDQGAYWLSAQEEIRNPYFGDRMLKCGRVEEELSVDN